MPHSQHQGQRRRHRVSGSTASQPRHRSPRTEDKQSKERYLSHAQHERRQRVLTQGKSALVSSVAEAVVIKNANIFSALPPMGVFHTTASTVLDSTITTAAFSMAMRCTSLGWPPWG
jgi:hypothetical protein